MFEECSKRLSACSQSLSVAEKLGKWLSEVGIEKEVSITKSIAGTAKSWLNSLDQLAVDIKQKKVEATEQGVQRFNSLNLLFLNFAALVGSFIEKEVKLAFGSCLLFQGDPHP